MCFGICKWIIHLWVFATDICMSVCACGFVNPLYLEIVSILQGEALSLQPDSFALFSHDAVDALVVVIVVGGEVRREQDTFWALWGCSTLSYRKMTQGLKRGSFKITAFLAVSVSSLKIWVLFGKKCGHCSQEMGLKFLWKQYSFYIILLLPVIWQQTLFVQNKSKS